MKIAAIIVRVLMGLLFIFGAVAFFLSPPPTLPDGNMKTYFEGLAASGYFFTFLKVTELICGIALVAGRYVPLALIILSPIIVNILFVHIFLERSGLPVAIILVIANSFLGYYYWNSFKPLFVAKAEI
jgi:putative oxidoreductase